VHNLESTGHLVRRIILLAILGFGVVMLGGPILAVISVVFSFGLVVLFFALVGFVVWSLIQAACFGNRVAWEAVPETAKKLGQMAIHWAGRCGQTLAGPFRFAIRVAERVGLVARGAWTRGWRAARLVGEISLVTLTGVLVGGLLGVIMGAQNHNPPDVAVNTNALLGGAIAAVAGVAMTVRERRATRSQPSNG
jgi:hypothetical protein